jgi:hypothetical protein
MSIGLVRTAIATLIDTTLKASPISLTSAAIGSENSVRPKVSGAWAQIFFKPNDPVVNTLSSTGRDRVTGVFLVNLHYPLATGNAASLDAYNAFRKAFTAGKILVSSGQECKIINCGGNLGRVVDSWYRADIHITFEAYLTRGSA